MHALKIATLDAMPAAMPRRARRLHDLNARRCRTISSLYLFVLFWTLFLVVRAVAGGGEPTVVCIIYLPVPRALLFSSVNNSILYL